MNLILYSKTCLPIDQLYPNVRRMLPTQALGLGQFEAAPNPTKKEHRLLG
jgi:hypothetical protein